MTTGAAAITLAAINSRAKVTHGLYWDDGRAWTVSNWPRLCAELRSMRIDHIVVVTNGSDAAKAGKADGRWSASQLGALRRGRNAPRVHAMVWASPTKAFARAFAKYCAELHQAGIDVVELDVERDVWGDAATDYADKETVARALVQIAIDAGLTVGVTMIPDRVYAGFERSDYISMQSYSRYHGGLAQFDGDGPYAPGPMQRRGANAAQRLGLPLVQALGAWDQRWGTRPLGPEMMHAYEAARATSRSVRWWSSKWVIGSRAQPEVRKIIEKLILA